MSEFMSYDPWANIKTRNGWKWMSLWPPTKCASPIRKRKARGSCLYPRHARRKRPRNGTRHHAFS